MKDHIKKEIRIVAFDDCSFKKSDKEVLLVGPVFRGGQFIDGLLSTKIKKDGLDATQKIASAINRSSHKGQLSVIMLDGITFGGFNIVDIKKLHKKTGLPVVVVLKNKPDLRVFRATIKHLFGRSRYGNAEERLENLDKAGSILLSGNVRFQVAGCSVDQAERLLRLTSTRSNIPEPVRVAHLIASGLRASK